MHERLKKLLPPAKAGEYESKNETEETLWSLYSMIALLRYGEPFGADKYPFQLDASMRKAIATTQRNALLFAYATLALKAPDCPYLLGACDWDDHFIGE